MYGILLYIMCEIHSAFYILFTSGISLLSCSTAFNTIALEKKKFFMIEEKMHFLQNIVHVMIPASDRLSRTPSMGRRRDRKTVTITALCRITVLNTARHGEEMYIDGTEWIYRWRLFSGSIKISLITVY